MAERERKRGVCKYKTFNILGTKRAFKMKQNVLFIVFERLSLGEKIKKIADTSFKKRCGPRTEHCGKP